VLVPREDFGELLFPGGAARFTEVEGGDARIFELPAQVPEEVLSFDFEIHPAAIGGSCIYVAGLEVRARARV
jgi:hypothetical protein